MLLTACPTVDPLEILEFDVDDIMETSAVISWEVSSDAYAYIQITLDNELYNVTDKPRKLWIIPGSSLHGSGLISHPGVFESLTEWFV